jgi:hypothetical protein
LRLVAIQLRFSRPIVRFPGEISLLNAAYHAVGLGAGSPSWCPARSHTIAI